MESSRITVASLLVLLAFAAATAEARLAKGLLIHEDAMQRTCSQVRFKKMCLKLPKVSTPQELLLASMRVATEKAKEAKGRIDAYAARYHGGLPMSSILGDCSTGYDNVVQTLEEAEQIVATQGTQVDLTNKLSDAVTHADDCDNSFQDFPDVKDPFLAVQKNVWRLVDNVLNIAAVVRQAGDAHPQPHGLGH